MVWIRGAGGDDGPGDDVAMHKPSAKALNEEELEALSVFLERCRGNGAMNLEQLDGLFTAVIIGPSTVMPSECWPLVFGGKAGQTRAFRDEQEFTRVIELVMRHWNSIARTLAKGGLVEMQLQRDSATHMTLGTDWATGFMRGVALRYADWMPLIDDREHGQLIAPILLLAEQKHPRTSRKSPSLSLEDRQDFLVSVNVRLNDLYAFFRRPSMPAVETIRRMGEKVGRNDPCPCGGGKKYKLCCGASGKPIVH